MSRDAARQDPPRIDRHTFRLIAWIGTHRKLARFVVRGPIREWVSRRVWTALDTPQFREEMRQSKADYATGRWYSFDTETGTSTPNPDWPKDGPQPRRLTSPRAAPAAYRSFRGSR